MFSKKDKIIFIFLLIIFIFATTVSYASSITLWISWEGKKNYQDIMNRFEEKTHIKVNIVYVPKILQKLKTISKAGGKLPDIALIRDSYVDDVERLGVVSPIDKGISKEASERGKFAFTYKGRLYALPFYFDTQVVYYNPILFKKAGISSPNINWTIKDLEAYAKRLKSIKGIIPFGWGGYSPYYFTGFEYSFRKDCVKCMARERFFTSATEKAILLYKKFIKEGIGVSLDRNAILSGFKKGKIGITIFGTFIIPDFLKDNTAFNILPLPINDMTGVRIPSYLDYKGFILFKGAHKEALALLKFLSEKEVQLEFCKPLYKFPDNDEALSQVLKDEPYLSGLKVTVETGVTAPKGAVYDRYNKALSNVLKLVLSRDVPINKAFEVGRKYLQGQK